MLSLIIGIWYLCGAAMVLYILACAFLLMVGERRLKRLSEDACFARTFLEKYALSDDENAFEYYRKKELLDAVILEYNDEAIKYNELVNGYPSCAVARVMGRRAVSLLKTE